MEIGKEMKKILNLLAERFEWLFTDYNFKITKSEYSHSFGGEGFIRLENSNIRIDLLHGDQSSFEKLAKARENLIQASIIDSRISKKRPAANLAFQQKNFSKAVELFESIEEYLSQSELKKLEYARKRLCKDETKKEK